MVAATTVEKDMSISHREFFRSLPRALGTDAYRVEGTTITVEDGGRRLDITLAPESERRIALLTLPVTLVTLRFTGYDEDEAAAALARFDQAFQRGGG